MRKTVLVFGLLSGAVSSAMMLLTVPFMDRIGFGQRSVVLGYTAIVASFLLVYFGIRSYRDRIAGGVLTFGRAFTVGILITLLSSACYVLTWQFVYFKLKPDFADQYSAYAIERARQSGASQQEIEATALRMEEFKTLLQNPLTNAAITFIVPVPVGLVVTLISATVLRRTRRP
jgi:hypothetical protein